jgi:hypothetical protein
LVRGYAATGVLVCGLVSGLLVFAMKAGDILIWPVIAVLALVLVTSFYSLSFPCESDHWRRCDLDAPNPFPRNCGLGKEHLC